MEERYKILNSVRNPLSIIALFVLSMEIMATVALANSSLSVDQRWWLIVLITVFPPVVFIAFILIVWCRPINFYGPQDYSSDQTFLKLMRQGKIEDEVDEIVQSDEGTVTESRMQATSWLSCAERKALEELLKEYNCPISQQVLSENRSFLFDAVIHKGIRWIYVEVKYVRSKFLSPRTIEQIRKFAQAAGNNTKILAIVTPESLDENKRAKYRTTIDEIDKSIKLRFYKL